MQGKYAAKKKSKTRKTSSLRERTFSSNQNHTPIVFLLWLWNDRTKSLSHWDSRNGSHSYMLKKKGVFQISQDKEKKHTCRYTTEWFSCVAINSIYHVFQPFSFMASKTMTSKMKLPFQKSLRHFANGLFQQKKTFQEWIMFPTSQVAALYACACN